MKDYSFYIATAYALTALVLAGLVLQSILKARAAETRSGKEDA